MNLLKLIEAFLGTAEEVVPVFIHNPKSQKIEGVVVGTMDGILEGLGTSSAGTAASTTNAPTKIA